MSRYALLLEYNGSSYYGWQSQPYVPTVQAELEKVLSIFTNHKVETITAGRTDTGVHATYQVVHFDTDVKRSAHGWIRGLNSLMNKDIRVKQILEVDPSFDARFSARKRTYHYYLRTNAVNSALFFNNIGWYYQQLDLAKMQQAADMLVGVHDFSSFRASECQANTPIRTMHAVNLVKRGDVIRIELCANAFLHHMVRNIVGALIYVGNGKISLDKFAELIQAKNRKLAPPTFMANGLYLTHVDYEQELFADYNPDEWIVG